MVDGSSLSALIFGLDVVFFTIFFTTFFFTGLLLGPTGLGLVVRIGLVIVSVTVVTVTFVFLGFSVVELIFGVFGFLDTDGRFGTVVLVSFKVFFSLGFFVAFGFLVSFGFFDAVSDFSSSISL